MSGDETKNGPTTLYNNKELSIPLYGQVKPFHTAVWSLGRDVISIDVGSEGAVGL